MFHFCFHSGKFCWSISLRLAPVRVDLALILPRSLLKGRLGCINVNIRESFQMNRFCCSIGLLPTLLGNAFMVSFLSAFKGQKKEDIS